MKSKRRIEAALTALPVLLSSVVAVSAITVEKDGQQYMLNAPTPTTGDINVLMIRTGFADYDIDDAYDPADSEATLLSYFDGSEDSINGYYETSSYGKLRLHCDEILTYTAKNERDSYTGDDLVEEALTALADKIDLNRYDSDGDGSLDCVIFDFAGSLGEWDTTWWPHVARKRDIGVGEKKIPVYSFLKGDAYTFIHEFGHILGAVDYYSYSEAHENNIATFDIMCSNIGDHNGFTKWSYGWLENDDIAFVDRAAGDTTVSLAPIETPAGDGKKIAVVAPAIDSANGFLDEYFLVEYDAGVGNNTAVFDEYALKAGFRIFHVRAGGAYDPEDMSVKYIKNNDLIRDNLIHNVKNELADLMFMFSEDFFFREGDSLTPDSNPNTGFAIEALYNGAFTGISFTDFVTGDNPSFKVSFSDSYDQNVDVDFSLIYNELNANMNLTLKADKPLVVRNTGLPQNYAYAPYLLDDKGNRLVLDIKQEGNSPYRFSLSYSKPSPPVQPNTEYTLVLPEGLFTTGYDQAVPEHREKLKTSPFLAVSVIAELPAEGDQMLHSNIFSVTENTFGIICVPYGNAGNSVFTEYNLNGEEIGSVSFALPSIYPEDAESKRLLGCRAFALNDGNFALEIALFDSVSYLKIDRNGNALSKVYHVGEEAMANYNTTPAAIHYDLYKGGLCKKLIKYPDAALLTIDFENEPQLTEMAVDRVYINLDGDSYAVWHMLDRELHLYDRADRQTGVVPCNATFQGCFGEDGRVKLMYTVHDREAGASAVYVDTYAKDGALIEHRDVTENALHLSEVFNVTRCHTSAAGYFLEYNYKATDDSTPRIFAYDRDWNYLGNLEISEWTNYAFSGVCGLTQRKDHPQERQTVFVISRFAIGDFEIVTKPEEPTEPATEPASEPAVEPTTEQTTEPSTNAAEAVTDGSTADSAINGNGAVQTGEGSALMLAVLILLALFAFFMIKAADSRNA